MTELSITKEVIRVSSVTVVYRCNIRQFKLTHKVITTQPEDGDPIVDKTLRIVSDNKSSKDFDQYHHEVYLVSKHNVKYLKMFGVQNLFEGSRLEKEIENCMLENGETELPTVFEELDRVSEGHVWEMLTTGVFPDDLEVILFTSWDHSFYVWSEDKTYKVQKWDYIEARLDNETYDLESLRKHLFKSNFPNVHKIDRIKQIPYYNAEEGRTHYFTFYYSDSDHDPSLDSYERIKQAKIKLGFDAYEKKIPDRT